MTMTATTIGTDLSWPGAASILTIGSSRLAQTTDEHRHVHHALPLLMQPPEVFVRHTYTNQPKKRTMERYTTS